jgi:hypothetical protein
VLIIDDTQHSLAEARNDPGMRELGRKMIRGGTDFIPYTDIKGRRCRLYYAPIPSVGWTLAVVFPEAELLALLRKRATARLSAVPSLHPCPASTTLSEATHGTGVKTADFYSTRPFLTI